MLIKASKIPVRSISRRTTTVRMAAVAHRNRTEAVAHRGIVVGATYYSSSAVKSDS